MGKEFTLTDRAFQRIVQYAKNYYGIDLSQKRVIVANKR